MSKPPKHFYYMYVGPYPVTVVFAPNARAWDRAVKKFNIRDAGPYPENAGKCLICWPENRDVTNTRAINMVIVVTVDTTDESITPSQLAGICAHEATHVWQFMVEMIGEENPSYEFEAYTIQSLTQGLLDSIRRYRKACKK